MLEDASNHLSQMPQCLCIQYRSFLHTELSYFTMYALCSVLPCDGHLESLKAFPRGRKASSPFCELSNIPGLEMLMYDEESDSSFDREAYIRKPSSVDCAVNTETSTNEKKLPKKTIAGFVKSLLAWLLLLFTVFTTCGAVKVDHKLHLPSTWLLLYQLLGPYLPLPTISVAFDSNPRPHIN